LVVLTPDVGGFMSGGFYGGGPKRSGVMKKELKQSEKLGKYSNLKKVIDDAAIVQIGAQLHDCTDFCTQRLRTMTYEELQTIKTELSEATNRNAERVVPLLGTRMVLYFSLPSNG